MFTPNSNEELEKFVTPLENVIKALKRKAVQDSDHSKRMKVAIESGVLHSSFEELEPIVTECLSGMKYGFTCTVIVLLKRIKAKINELTNEDADLTDEKDEHMWLMCLAIIKALTEYLKLHSRSVLTINKWNDLNNLNQYFIEQFKYYNLEENEIFTLDKIVEYTACIFIGTKSKTVSMIKKLGL